MATGTSNHDLSAVHTVASSETGRFSKSASVPDSRSAAVVPSVTTWGITARARSPVFTFSTVIVRSAATRLVSTRERAVNKEPKRSRVGRWSAAKSAVRNTPLSHHRLPECRTSDRRSYGSSYRLCGAIGGRARADGQLPRASTLPEPEALIPAPTGSTSVTVLRG